MDSRLGHIVQKGDIPKDAQHCRALACPNQMICAAETFTGKTVHKQVKKVWKRAQRLPVSLDCDFMACPDVFLLIKMHFDYAIRIKKK